MEDTEFNEFQEQLQEYTPVLPDIVLEYYMEKCGLTTCDENVKKAISLISHKFLTDVATAAFQYHKIHLKAAQKDKRFAREKKITLQLSDLEKALEDMGIDVTRPHYYL